MAAAGGWRPELSPPLPEIAFVGRSNVGKSSLINLLVRQRAAARVSKTPGRTQEINFFRINDAFVLVDLPGYGYSKAPKTVRDAWQPLIDQYLGSNVQLRGVVLLIDVRRGPNAADRALLDQLAHTGVPTLIAATKIDTMSRGAVDEATSGIATALGLDAAQVVPTSSVTGAGRDELAAAVVALVAATPTG